MTIWLLGLLLVASVAALGFRQGAIRVGCSFFGIVLGTILAPPLGRLLKPVLSAVGLKNPFLLWVLGPLLVFIIISALVKVGAMALHHKVDVYYKYKAGDLRLALWERLNSRVGLCLGVLNGVAYLVIISFLVFAFSYWTVQTASSDSDPKTLKILNRLGEDLQSSGFNKVARSIDHLPESYYDTADVAGLIYNNSLLEARLARYPGLLGIAEKPEFQDLANDKEFAEMRQRRDPVRNVLEYSKIQAIINNPDLLKNLWATLIPDLKDLRAYLETGKSAKYDSERILGRWNFDVNSAMAMMRRAKPNIPSTEMQKLKKWMAVAFAKTSLVAMPDGQVLLKNVPQMKAGAAAAPGAGQTTQGQWKKVDGKYQLTITINGKDEQAPLIVEGDRLSVASQDTELAFTRED